MATTSAWFVETFLNPHSAANTSNLEAHTRGRGTRGCWLIVLPLSHFGNTVFPIQDRFMASIPVSTLARYRIQAEVVVNGGMMTWAKVNQELSSNVLLLGLHTTA